MMHKKSSMLAGAMLAALSLTAPAESSPAPTAQTETFRATVQSIGAGPGGQTSAIIQITRWTTDEERAALLQVLAEEGTKPLAEALNKEEEVGFIRFPQMNTRFPSVRLRYARQTEVNGERVIILATDRPIGIVEAVRQNPWTFDYQISLIQLNLDDANTGSGILAVGVEMELDLETNTLGITNMGTNPIRLTNVRPS